MAEVIIRLKELMHRTGLARSTIYDRIDMDSPRHDPEFPKPRKLGGTAVGWSEEDVEAWLLKCKNEPQPRSKRVQPKPQNGGKTKVNKPSTSSKRPTTITAELSTDEPTNLAEAVVQGSAIIAKIQRYLDMDGWTPAMGAMLLSGIEPPENCEEIPSTGVGLNGKPCGPDSEGIIEANRLFQLWKEFEEDETAEIAEASESVARGELERTVETKMSNPEFKQFKMKLPTEQDRLHKPVVLPSAFLYWCMYNEIETKWLPFFKGLVGFSSPREKELASVRAAMMMGQIY